MSCLGLPVEVVVPLIAGVPLTLPTCCNKTFVRLESGGETKVANACLSGWLDAFYLFTFYMHRNALLFSHVTIRAEHWETSAWTAAGGIPGTEYIFRRHMLVHFEAKLHKHISTYTLNILGSFIIPFPIQVSKINVLSLEGNYSTNLAAVLKMLKLGAYVLD